MARWKKIKKKGWKNITISFIDLFKKCLLSTYCLLSLMSDVETMDIK